MHREYKSPDVLQKEENIGRENCPESETSYFHSSNARDIRKLYSNVD